MPFVSMRNKYIISPYMDWLSFFFNRQWYKTMDGMISLMIKLADVEQGDVHHNHMQKLLTPLDHQRLQQGVNDCRELGSWGLNYCTLSILSDSPSDGSHNDSHQRTKQVEEAIRQISHRGHAQHRRLSHATGVPWHQY